MLPHPLEASPQKANLEILLQNMTPNSRISAIISQDLLSQHSRNSEALSQQLLSQSSHPSPSKHIHPDCLRFDTPSQGLATPAQRSERISQQSELLTKIFQRKRNLKKHWRKLKAKEEVNDKLK